jgi:hypothetical protein
VGQLSGPQRAAKPAASLLPKPRTSERRPLAIAAVRGRIVQAAMKIVLEPVFEADFLPAVSGSLVSGLDPGVRPGRGTGAPGLQGLDDGLVPGLLAAPPEVLRWPREEDLESVLAGVGVGGSSGGVAGGHGRGGLIMVRTFMIKLEIRGWERCTMAWPA